MNYFLFLNKIIELGIEAATKDYNRPDQKSIREGSIMGFEACRNKNILQLAQLLEESRQKSQDHILKRKNTKKFENEHWKLRGYELEVEWVCNVLSAALVNQGMPPIVQPTARGLITAANILGIKQQ